MSEKISTRGIGLLVVGLIIGAAGGYYYNLSSLTPVVNQLESEKQALTATVDSKTTEIAALTEQFNGLDATMKSLTKDVSNLNGDKTRAESAISGLDQSATSYNIAIADLREKGDAPTGYEVFSAYGLVFDYPEGMNFRISEFNNTRVSQKEGILRGEVENTKKESVEYVWQYIDFDPDMRDYIDTLTTGYVDKLAPFPEVTTTVGSVKIDSIEGHTVYYQPITVNDAGTVGLACHATWFCDEEQIVYILFVYDSLSTDVDTIKSYIGSTLCH